MRGPPFKWILNDVMFLPIRSQMDVTCCVHVQPIMYIYCVCVSMCVVCMCVYMYVCACCGTHSPVSLPQDEFIVSKRGRWVGAKRQLFLLNQRIIITKEKDADGLYLYKDQLKFQTLSLTETTLVALLWVLVPSITGSSTTSWRPALLSRSNSGC